MLVQHERLVKGKKNCLVRSGRNLFGGPGIERATLCLAAMVTELLWQVTVVKEESIDDPNKKRKQNRIYFSMPCAYI